MNARLSSLVLIAAIVISSISIPHDFARAVELFAVGPNTAQYYDGSAWHETTGHGDFKFENFYGVWGSSGSDIYAVGSNGTIVHYDGSDWSEMTSGVTVTLKDIWGASASELIAVGNVGTALHGNGSNWSEKNTKVSNNLRAVWGFSGSDVYAVGDSIVLHFNGSKWSEVDVGYTDIFVSVWGSSPSDVFIAGQDDTGPEYILHYDGIGWTRMSIPSYHGVYDLWGSSGSDVYACGPYGSMLHYDGATWSEQTDVGVSHLYSLSGNAADDIYVAGVGGQIFHYDGSTWDQVLNTQGPVLYDIHAVSGTCICAVGKMSIYCYSEGAWHTVLLSLSDVWGRASNDVYATGGAWIHHWDGFEWTEMPSPTIDEITGIWGVNGSYLFIVTAKWNGRLYSGERNGRIYHYDGLDWSLMVDAPDCLYDIYGTAGNDIYAVGMGALVYHFDGSIWNVMRYDGCAPGGNGNCHTFYSVWATAAGEIFAGGIYEYYWEYLFDWGAARIDHYDGSAWGGPASKGMVYDGIGFHGIWGHSGDDVYAIYGRFQLFNYDGVEWIYIRQDLMYDTWGSASDDVYVTGQNGAIYHYDGVDWSETATGFAGDLHAVWGWAEPTADDLPPDAPFTLNQNYPNPFNPVTTIEYYLPGDAHVTLAVYDVSGRHVVTLVDEEQPWGSHMVPWNGRSAEDCETASGVYFYQIKAGDFVQTKKMVLLR